MAKHRERDQVYWCLPGGALECDETLEEGALRELREEAGVDGRILRLVGQGLDDRGNIDTYTFWVDIGDQEPALGHDPEVDHGTPILVGIEWLSPREIPERDRVFLWRAGLLSVPGFLDEVAAWGDEVSYPAAGCPGQGPSTQ